MKLPKIPKGLFEQLVTFFYEYATFEVEVMGVFYWDTENERYVLDIPFQNVSKVSVDACYSHLPPHFIKVAEIHSHNSMKAYFSDIDDRDELGTMLYGVVGRIEKGINRVHFELRTPQVSADSFRFNPRRSSKGLITSIPSIAYIRSGIL